MVNRVLGRVYVGLIPGTMITCHRLDVICVAVAVERLAVLDSSVKGAKLGAVVNSA